MIVLYGGTFDPPHLGHIHLIQKLFSLFPITKLFLVPNQRNPLKTQSPHLSPDDRKLLLETAVRGLDSRIELLDFELKKPGPSYTIDTVRFLETQLQESLTVVIGNELFTDLPFWKEAPELMRKVDWIVVNRVENPVKISSHFLHALNIIDGTFCSENHFAYCQNTRSILFCEIEALPFSSTQIRSEIADLWKKNQLETPPQGIQRSVWLLIKEKRLYSVG